LNWSSFKKQIKFIIIKGKKGIVFSSANAFGGSNYVLSYLYIGIGVLSIVISIVFFLKTKFYPERLIHISEFKDE
jgi:hypothetical protein